MSETTTTQTFDEMAKTYFNNLRMELLNTKPFDYKKYEELKPIFEALHDAEMKELRKRSNALKKQSREFKVNHSISIWKGYGNFEIVDADKRTVTTLKIESVRKLGSDYPENLNEWAEECYGCNGFKRANLIAEASAAQPIEEGN